MTKTVLCEEFSLLCRNVDKTSNIALIKYIFDTYSLNTAAVLN